MGFAHRRVVCIMVAIFDVLEFSSRGFFIYGSGVFEFFLFTCHVCLVSVGIRHLHYDCAFFCFGRRASSSHSIIYFLCYFGSGIDRLFFSIGGLGWLAWDAV